MPSLRQKGERAPNESLKSDALSRCGMGRCGSLEVRDIFLLARYVRFLQSAEARFTMSINQIDDRAAALKRLNERRDFSSNVVAYVIVNLAFVGVWFFTGRGYFWPAWILGFWGMGLLLHAWAIWLRKPITEEDVQREMRHVH